MEEIQLGDLVKDPISGFKGIAVSRHQYLQGCNRISVQPPVNKDGALPDVASFDEPQLEIVKKKKVERKAPANKSGGPEKYTDKRRY